MTTANTWKYLRFKVSNRRARISTLHTNTDGGAGWELYRRLGAKYTLESRSGSISWN